METTITKNKIKPGYKQTPVGIIPEDWEVDKIENWTIRIGDGIHSTPKYSSDGRYYFINGNNLKSGKIVFNDITKRVNEEEFNKHYRELTSRTILMSINGTIGNLAYYNNEDVVLGKSACYLNLKKEISLEYFYYQIGSYLIQKSFLKRLTGSTIKNLGLNEIKNTKLPIPPFPEQEHIASCLTTWDKGIEKLSQLIAAKKQQKKGLMQRLLTGEKRLDGFTEEWEEVKLGNVSNCLDNLRVPLNSTERDKIQGNIPYCGANGIVDYVNDFVIDDDIILVAEDGGNFDEFQTKPIAYRMIGKCWVNNHAHILKAKESFSHLFLFYSLVHKNVLPYISGGTRAKLNKKHLLQIKLNAPKDIKEQTSITEILSTADQEIDLLEKKLETVQLQKKGLMQVLLTGKERLV